MAEHEKQKNTLDEMGIIFLSGCITTDVANSIGKQIIEYNVKDECEYIQLLINSAGGECAAGFSLIDLMAWSRLPIYTIGLGMVASMGLLIFMAGEKRHRVLTPNTSILSHRFWSLQIGNHSQLLALRKQQDLEHRRIINHYLRHTEIKDVQELESTLLRDVDVWLSPQEAVEFGLADSIAAEANVNSSATERN